MPKIVWLVLVLIVIGLSFLFIKPKATPSDWLTFTDEAGVYTFRYPQDFGRPYVTPVDWPPQVNLLENSSLNCNPYCITTTDEGAAGSTYRQYTYLTKHDGQVMRLVFTARLPQCLNYDQPKQSECQQDQAKFNPDVIIDQIIGSLIFNLK